LQVNAQGRLSDPEEFSNIIVRGDPASGEGLSQVVGARRLRGTLPYLK